MFIVPRKEAAKTNINRNISQQTSGKNTVDEGKGFLPIFAMAEVQNHPDASRSLHDPGPVSPGVVMLVPIKKFLPSAQVFTSDLTTKSWRLGNAQQTRFIFYHCVYLFVNCGFAMMFEDFDARFLITHIWI